MSAALETQKALYEAMSSNNALTVLLDGARIHDDLPEKTDPPYILFGTVESLDWSTDGSVGEEHFIDLEIWSNRNGRKQAAQIAEQIKASITTLCADAPVVMSDHQLVNLTVENLVSERIGPERLFKAVVTLRAVSETISE